MGAITFSFYSYVHPVFSRGVRAETHETHMHPVYNRCIPGGLRLAGSESTENIPALRPEEIAVSAVQHAAAAGPGAAAQHFGGAEQRPRIIRVSVGAKSWVGLKAIACPFPYIA